MFFIKYFYIFGHIIVLNYIQCYIIFCCNVTRKNMIQQHNLCFYPAYLLSFQGYSQVSLLFAMACHTAQNKQCFLHMRCLKTLPFLCTSYKGYIIRYIYIALFLGPQSASHGRGNLFNHHQCAASTWPGWCDCSHIAPERPPHTSLLVERTSVMKPISIWAWSGGHDGYRGQTGKFGQDADYSSV